MKTSNKSSLVTGIVLLLVAAVFSISLFFQLLDFGVGGPGHNNILFLLGDIIFTFYGFSSILIPAFLFVAGLSCFATRWTAKNTMRLLTALVPFFTCVFTENICRSIIALGNSNFMGVKLFVAVVTGLMLVVIEFLGAGIIADKITKGTLKINIPHKNREDKQEKEKEHTFALPKFNKLSLFKKSKEEEAEEVTEEYSEDDYEDYSELGENEPDETTIFDDALESIEPFDGEETSVEAQPEPVQEVEEPVQESQPVEETQDEDTKRSSMITQEEFAALTREESPAQEDIEIEEMEWPNLPPQPEKLPPEYDEDFDENDPALKFPPDEEESENQQNVAEQQENESSFAEYSDEEEAEIAQNSDYEIEHHTANNDDAEEGFSTGSESSSSIPYKKNDDPYAASRYLDKVVENPNFSHGIVIRDGNEEESEAEEAPESPKQIYPTRIRLEESVVNSKPEPQISDDDEYVEDETLPFPKFDLEEPAINTKPAISESHLNDIDTDEYSNEMEQVIGVFNDDEEDDGTYSEIESDYEDDFDAAAEGSKKSEPEPEKKTEVNQNVKSVASNVFMDMEADIRRNNQLSQKNQQEKPVSVNMDGSVAKEQDVFTLRPQSATNLTADELTDFFNAQQAENAPKGTEIAANPPKIGNRAVKKGPYVIPSDLLIAYKDDQYWIIDDATKQASINLKQTLAEFGIEAEITGIKKGPVVTMFEILPAPGVRLQKIVALQDNIALSLAAQSVRIVAPIPGKQAVGIEVPNMHRSIVGFREIIEMDLPEWNKMAVPVVLGKDILGKAQLVDLVKTPHMLIAGATGSGKSVCVNSLILSILYKRSFQDVKMILVDPKVVELKLYNNIPHLLTPVITEPKKALQALKWSLCEMERRYALLDQMGVRDISNYNTKIKEQKICTEKLPYIVIIIDEFADLMATSGKELESIVARLTAMSRAVGIHLVLATQRPSVNVITGLIKANIPTRIAFMVASRTDSNIIIDAVGAEKLLGRGDMLYASAVDPAPVRIQGTFVTDQEVEDVVRTVKEYGEPDYIDEEIFFDDEEEDGPRDLFGEPIGDEDPLYDQALEIVVQSGKASASFIQRKLKIGYNRAARLVEEMEERGIVGPANGSKPREIIHIP